ncbi:unnamed protein product, partial [Lampetra planeri]
MDVSHEFSLSVITWLGLLLSCLCLLLSVATFCACRSLQSDRTTLHKNLALCLLVANVVFLAGVGQTAHKAVCALVAALLHFAFLAAFLWMLLEGVQLYVMLVQVNVGFLTLTLYKMIRHSSHVKPVSGNTGSLRSWTLGCASLLCLLGLTWTFGLLFVSRGSLPLAYLFTILNSAQGVFIFTFHCLMQKKVRKEYARFLSRFCPGLARLGDSFTSTTTTNPNSTTNSSLHSSTRGSSTR